MKILVMGGTGVTGTRVRKLLADSDAVVDYSSRHESDDPHQVTLNLSGSTSRIIDVLSTYDWVIACVGPFEKILDKVALLCMKAGTNYIDVNDSIDAREAILALPARDAGVVMVTGAGLCPGLSTALMMSIPTDDITQIRAELPIGKGQPSGAAAVQSMMSTMHGGYRMMQNRQIVTIPHQVPAERFVGYECPDIGAVGKVFPQVQDYSYFVAFEALSGQMVTALQQKRIFSLPVISTWLARKASRSVSRKALEANQPHPASLSIAMQGKSELTTVSLSGLTSYEFTAVAAASAARFLVSDKIKPGAYEVADLPKLADYLLAQSQEYGARISRTQRGL